MKFKMSAFALISAFTFGAHAQSTCEVLINVQQGGNLAQMRQGTPKVEPKSCDDFLKGELSFDQKEYPNAPTKWLGGNPIKWSEAMFGRQVAVYTSTTGRQFNYNGKIEKNTSEEFLFTGKDNSMRVDAKFHIKRDKDGKITYALYEFDSQVSGIFRIGKE